MSTCTNRIAKYWDPEGVGTRIPPQERKVLESEVVRVMIPKSSDATKATSIFQHGKYQVHSRLLFATVRPALITHDL